MGRNPFTRRPEFIIGTYIGSYKTVVNCIKHIGTLAPQEVNSEVGGEHSNIAVNKKLDNIIHGKHFWCCLIAFEIYQGGSLGHTLGGTPPFSVCCLLVWEEWHLFVCLKKKTLKPVWRNEYNSGTNRLKLLWSISCYFMYLKTSQIRQFSETSLPPCNQLGSYSDSVALFKLPI